MRQTSRPERTRRLPNGDLDLRHVDLSTKAPVEFLRRGRLEEKLQRFGQVRACLGYRVSLARDIYYFGAQGDIAVAVTFDDCGQVASHRTSSYRQRSFGGEADRWAISTGPPSADGRYRPDPLPQIGARPNQTRARAAAERRSLTGIARAAGETPGLHFAAWRPRQRAWRDDNGARVLRFRRLRFGSPQCGAMTS